MTDGVLVRAETWMGTFVTIQVVGPETEQGAVVEREAALDRAFEWFGRIEACCTRFNPESELMRLSAQFGVAVPASPMLFEAAHFALAVAEESGGAFDPTVGHAMERRGFDREHHSGQRIHTALDSEGPVSYRDVLLNPAARTITLRRPLILDLGAVAKGLAIDMAARELDAFDNYAIDAGGDLYLGGSGPRGVPWSVGIRHPRETDALIDVLCVSDRAVCTSGDYERRRAGTDAGHHILDPRTGVSADLVASATVVAPTAMVADALATAAFVLGPVDGLRLLARHGVDGLIVSPTLERYATPGISNLRSTVLQDAEGPSHRHPHGPDRVGLAQ